MKRIYNYFPENQTVSATAKISVHNLTSSRSGGAVKNQFIIRHGYDFISFQSYNALCLTYDNACRVLTVYPEAFNYSTTTSKYSKKFILEELWLSVSEFEKIKKMAKSEDFGRDCPLYIQF